jgi:hypothetical protein
MKKFTNLEETLSFYGRNDYAIINNLLWGNMDELWKVAEVAIGDNFGVLKEYDEGIRIINSELDKRWIEILQKRLFENLDGKERKEKILETAKNDIANILSAMKPLKKEIMLYRTVSYKRIGDIRYNINDIIEFKNISSTSVIPIWEDKNFEFYRYEITVPENGLVLELDEYPDVKNEHGEVLLPPMKCKVKDIRSNDNGKCKGIFELEYIEKLLVDIQSKKEENING